MALPYGPACRDPPPPSTSKNCLSTGWLRQPTYYSTVLSATLWLCPLVNRVVATTTLHCRRLREHGGWMSVLALPCGPACHDPPSKYQQELSTTSSIYIIWYGFGPQADTLILHCRGLQEHGGWISGLALPFGPACHDPPYRYQQERLVYRVAAITYLLLYFTICNTMAFGLQSGGYGNLALSGTTGTWRVDQWFGPALRPCLPRSPLQVLARTTCLQGGYNNLLATLYFTICNYGVWSTEWWLRQPCTVGSLTTQLHYQQLLAMPLG